VLGTAVGHTINGGTNGFGAGFEADSLFEAAFGFDFFCNDDGDWGGGGGRDGGNAITPEGLDGNKRSRFGELGKKASDFLFLDEFLAGKGDRTDNNQNGEDERQKFERRSLHGG